MYSIPDRLGAMFLLELISMAKDSQAVLHLSLQCHYFDASGELQTVDRADTECSVSIHGDGEYAGERWAAGQFVVVIFYY